MSDQAVGLTGTRSDPFLGFLSSLSGEHVHFYPKSGNAGDGFITYATYLLFKRYGITATIHKQGDDVEGQTVLIGGGGNLVQGRYGDVAELVRRLGAKNNVVVMPHTIVGFADVLAETHRNLTVFCRERVSYDLALANGSNPASTYLSEDIVFFLDDDHFKEHFQSGEGTLTAVREDGETSGTFPVPPGNIDISMSWNGDLWTSEEFARHSTHTMAAYIAPHETVLTDRLHVAILSAFLQKRVFVMPNAYFKNRAIFEHSLKPRFPKVRFVNTLPTVDATVEEISATDKLHRAQQVITELQKNADGLRQEEILLQRKAVVLQQNVEELEREVARCKAEIAARSEHSRTYEERVARLQADLDETYAQREQLADHARLLDEQIRAIKESTSWRVTGPLRKAARLIRRK
ncbi:polysaccharide pyruvyl transferase family protein [Chelatococcus sp. GCM10030263]|uniref:polysaccharide pyruvyl transferase family protein n=1 Tax=Chelatococcus sp. GCM10030263 TaxID=3273387 RepID=UPI00361E6E15